MILDFKSNHQHRKQAMSENIGESNKCTGFNVSKKRTRDGNAKSPAAKSPLKSDTHATNGNENKKTTESSDDDEDFCMDNLTFITCSECHRPAYLASFSIYSKYHINVCEQCAANATEYMLPEVQGTVDLVFVCPGDVRTSEPKHKVVWPNVSPAVLFCDGELGAFANCSPSIQLTTGSEAPVCIKVPSHHTNLIESFCVLAGIRSSNGDNGCFSYTNRNFYVPGVPLHRQKRRLALEMILDAWDWDTHVWKLMNQPNERNIAKLVTQYCPFPNVYSRYCYAYKQYRELKARHQGAREGEVLEAKRLLAEQKRHVWNHRFRQAIENARFEWRAFKQFMGLGDTSSTLVRSKRIHPSLVIR